MSTLEDKVNSKLLAKATTTAVNKLRKKVSLDRILVSANIEKETFMDWAEGNQNIDGDNLVALCRALGVKPSKLFLEIEKHFQF